MSTDFKNFANSFQAVARLQLEGITCLMKHLGNPQNQLKFVHVAGTNGKGSVCNFLRSIFTTAGIRTGLYTSPNLISVCERISVDGELIGNDNITRILEKVEGAAEKVKIETGALPTQFEIWTAAAFCYFSEQKCELVVLETGLGGERDATNVILPPLASVITTIDIDHVEYLGSRLEGIAEAKAGIIKKGCPITVSAKQKPEAEAVLQKHCSEKQNRLIVANEAVLKDAQDFCEVFDYTLNNGKHFGDIKCGICGFYQPENAVLAIETANALGIATEHIKNGIAKATHRGRFEIIRQNPAVIYDGAHNPNGMTALAKCLNRYFPKWDGATFIMAFMGDKDIAGELKILKDSGLLKNSKIFAVQVKNNPRAAETDRVCRDARTVGADAFGYAEIKDAYKDALKIGKPVIICGSLYLYKDFDEIRD
ncbi:MAG: bifunctional folylpolyglutamate synthase/dihydrofolate synthase [Clostridia bacterium]|nr:bifunctional folylpolyglutamate synthase/dihydrofolate synthase [Clostridia bacterium]